MTIAVLSGKGGAGKTFLSVNLSLAIKNNLDKTVAYCDCDVEEPNGFLFFEDREELSSESVFVSYPRFDFEKCISCRKCVDICAFNALYFVKNRPKLMGGVCHSCEGCVLACPTGAVSLGEREIGKLTKATFGGINLFEGRQNIGEATGIKIINSVIAEGKNSDITIIDCPPGSACSAMECVKEADFCLVIGEPTSYGIHDLKMVSKMIDVFGKPCYYVINKSEAEDNPLSRLLLAEKRPLLCQIPFSKEIAERTSKGVASYGKDQELTMAFDKIVLNLFKEVRA